MNRLLPIVLAPLLASCAAPLEMRYEGTDAVTITSVMSSLSSFTFGAGANCRVVDANGVRRSPPYPPGDQTITVRPGRQFVGVSAWQAPGPTGGYACLSFTAEPGSRYEISASKADNGFVVALVEVIGERRHPVTSRAVPFRRPGEEPLCTGSNPAYMDSPGKQEIDR